MPRQPRLPMLAELLAAARALEAAPSFRLHELSLLWGDLQIACGVGNASSRSDYIYIYIYIYIFIHPYLQKYCSKRVILTAYSSSSSSMQGH
jgi:hypothetical protein